MRKALILGLTILASPAWAWEVTVGAICTLTHQTQTADVRLTFDPSLPEYSIVITRHAGAWPVAPGFRMTFGGLGGLTIATDRHVLSDGGRTLTVTDRGFGNVLNGLAAGGQVVSESGAAREVVPADGAAPAVETFRRCAPVAGV